MISAARSQHLKHHGSVSSFPPSSVPQRRKGESHDASVPAHRLAKTSTSARDRGLAFPCIARQKQSKTWPFPCPYSRYWLVNSSMKASPAIQQDGLLHEACLSGRTTCDRRVAAVGYMHSFDFHRRDHRTDQTLRVCLTL